MQRNNLQQGSALITALFIMVLVAIVAVSISTQLKWDISRTRLTLTRNTLHLASDAILFWAMDTLSQDKPFNIALDDNGTVVRLPKSLKLSSGVTVHGEIVDLQSRFNVNNLQDRQNQTLFYHLLSNTLDIEPKKRYDITHAVSNWVSTMTGKEANNKHYNALQYLAKTPPYYPAYQAMKNSSELQLVHGMNNSLFTLLAPYVTTLPEPTKLNVNTAPSMLLKSLGVAQPLYDSQIEEIQLTRKEKPFRTKKQMSAFLNKFNIPEQDLTFESNYFLGIAHCQSPSGDLTVYSVLRRTKSKTGNYIISLISQSMVAP